MPLRTSPEPNSPFDRLTALAQAIFDAPSAMASIVEDQRTLFRSTIGFPQSEMRRELTVTHILVGMGPGAILVIPDGLADPRTANHPLVTGAPFLRWFVGMTITDGRGVAVGAIGVMDVKARPAPTAEQMATLAVLAQLAGDIVDRAREARQRDEQLTMLRMAEEMSGVGYWRWDAETGTITWSDEIYRIHGIEPQSVEPTLAAMVEQYDEADRPELARLVRRAVEHGDPYEFRLRLTRKDGARRWVVANAVASVDPTTGKTTSLFGLFQDVTEQQETLDRVSRSEERYRLLAEHMGDVITRVRADGTSKYISPAIHSMLGWTVEEMSGQAMDYIHPDDRDEVLHVGMETVRTGKAQTLQHRALHRDGREVWVESGFQKITGGADRPDEVVIVIRDITVRKALESELRAAKEAAEAAAASVSESEARYRLIADRSTDVIATYGLDGIVAYISPSVEVISGRKPADVLGRPVTDLIHEDDVPRVLEEFMAFMQSGGTGCSRYRTRCLDGTIKWMEARRAIVRDEAGRISEF